MKILCFFSELRRIYPVNFVASCSEKLRHQIYSHAYSRSCGVIYCCMIQRHVKVIDILKYDVFLCLQYALRLRILKDRLPPRVLTMESSHVLGHRDGQHQHHFNVSGLWLSQVLPGENRATDLPHDVFWNPVVLHCRSQSSIIHVSSCSGGPLGNSLQVT